MITRMRLAMLTFGTRVVRAISGRNICVVAEGSNH